jgi:hypothetical protein
MVNLVLVEKSGELVESKMKDFNFDSLYKKCKFRKEDGFSRRTIWKLKLKGDPYRVALYARDFGKGGMENKYDLPPPVDQTLYFGVMALVRLDMEDNQVALDMDKALWLKIYEKLFGGFHNLADTAQEDMEEEDELDNVPADQKTKHGYLKDDFIVDDSHSSSAGQSPNDSSIEEPTDDEYESELDFEEYEYMDSSDEPEEEEDMESSIEVVENN